MKTFHNFLIRSKNVITLTLLLIRKKIRRLQSKPVIYCIGDSHSLLFQHPLFDIKYIGPATAYRLGALSSSNSSSKKVEEILKNLPPRKQNIILLVFGEIDARIHIYKATKEKGITLNEAILETVSSYINYVHRLQVKYPETIFMILNVLPQGEQGNFYGYKYYADRDTRVAITKDLNTTLKSISQKNGIDFIEAYDELIDVNSQRKKEFIFDEIHFSNKIVPYVIHPIKSSLEKRGIKI